MCPPLFVCKHFALIPATRVGLSGPGRGTIVILDNTWRPILSACTRLWCSFHPGGTICKRAEHTICEWSTEKSFAPRKTNFDFSG